MSGNQITNAGFQEGTTAFAGGAGMVLSVDETLFGYEGRAVLKGAKAVVNADQVSLGVTSDFAITGLTAGRTIEVFAHHAFTHGTTLLMANFYTNADVLVSSLPVPVQSYGDNNPRLGLSKSFNFSHARLVVPNTATRVRLTLYGTATSAGAGLLLLMKPYIEQLPSASTKYRCWDPGPSVNIDLSLAHWPSELPHLRAENFNVEPIPTRKGFQSDIGVTVTKKLVNVPWYRVQGAVKVDQEMHAILDQFFRKAVRGASDPFWFVRPDTLQLCRATWLADGDPVYSGLGADKMASFGLQIQVA